MKQSAKKQPTKSKSTKPAAKPAKAEPRKASSKKAVPSESQEASVPEAPAPDKHPVGAPVKLSPEVQQLLVNAIRAGNTYETASAYAGIAYSTLRNWIRAAEAGDVRFLEFLEAVKKAEADNVAASVARIQLAARGGQAIEKQTTTVEDGTKRTTRTVEKYTAPAWQADAWLLERRHPQHWGRRDRTTTVQYDLARLTDAQLARFEQLTQDGIPAETAYASCLANTD